MSEMMKLYLTTYKNYIKPHNTNMTCTSQRLLVKQKVKIDY